MSLKVLIVPDKFKGTLSAPAAAAAIARGWRKARRDDALELLPMSDGGDGFGEVLSGLLGAKKIALKTMDAAHRPIRTHWWWEPKSRTAIIESANVIGLALLPGKQFHPF
ncbi:MAG TPA: glycerate kinase, partial [Verrucomicrobiae bacterium]|nr:glycerate kinase [Verrucomicrobiae bacterium]